MTDVGSCQDVISGLIVKEISLGITLTVLMPGCGGGGVWSVDCREVGRRLAGTAHSHTPLHTRDTPTQTSAAQDRFVLHHQRPVIKS